MAEPESEIENVDVDGDGKVSLKLTTHAVFLLSASITVAN